MHRHLESSPAFLPALGPIALAAALLGLVACAFEYDADFQDDTGAGWDSDTAPEDSIDDTSGWDGMTPGYWSLGATVLMEEGVPVAGDSTVTLGLLDAELGADGLICIVSWSAPSFEGLDVPDTLVFHWWSVDALGTFGGSCTAAQRRFLPDRTLLGIGALFADVAAVLEPAGYGEVADSLYGAYIQPSAETDAPTWAFGVAATEGGYAGATFPVTAPPVPNGTYRLEPIYLLPIEGW